MDNAYDLVKAIRNTKGAQQLVWINSLGDMVMGAVHDYADACAAPALSSRRIEEQLGGVRYLLDNVLQLIPEEVVE